VSESTSNRPYSKRQTTPAQLCLALVAGFVFGLPFLYAELFFLSWFSLIPLLYLLEKASVQRSYLLGLIFGLGVYIPSTYWIGTFITSVKAYEPVISASLSILFWLFCAQLTAFIGVGYSILRSSTRISSYLIFPVIFVSMFSLFPQLFPAHPSASQSRFLIALQGIELVGVYGLDFLIALNNVMMFHLLSKAKRQTLDKIYSYSTCLILLAWFGYGTIRLHQWDNEIQDWEQLPIGIVQPNEPANIDIPPAKPGYSYAYPLEMAYSEKLVNAGARLIIWPETRFKGYFQHSHVQHAFTQRIAALDTSLIFQDIEKRRDIDGNILTHNTAILIPPLGEDSPQHYRKQKLIPIGEMIPVVGDKVSAMKYIKPYLGRFFGELSPGESHTIFTKENLKIAPLICYEALFPQLAAAAMVTGHHSTDRATSAPDLFVILSNNAWFGNTSQTYQHLNASILRSIENRRPIIHAINNGPSAVIMPSGRIGFSSSAHTEGAYISPLPYQTSLPLSFFSRHPRLFINTVYFALALLALLLLYKTSRNVVVKATSPST